MTILNLWKNRPQGSAHVGTLEYYPALRKTTDATVIVFPGGGYACRAPHEGEGYAQLLNTLGMDAFVCQYSVSPNCHPLPLLDARRAVQLVRSMAEEFKINPQKIGVMGSSAGGHLAASLCTVQDLYSDVLTTPDAIDSLSFQPNFQILCYPVISLCADFGHTGSGNCLLGTTDLQNETRLYLAPHKLVHKNTPPAFVWHTITDSVVPVENSLHYVSALHQQGIDAELHIFPLGEHGLGTASDLPQVHQWVHLLENWLRFKGVLS